MNNVTFLRDETISVYLFYEGVLLRQILPFKQTHIRMEGTYMPKFMVIALIHVGGYGFENSIDHEILEICSIYQTPVELLKPRELF